MAQDFGDDIGDLLVRSFSRAFNKVLYDIMSEYAKSWYSERNEKKGMSKEDAAIEAEAMASRPQVCISFGSSDDASYFAQVCRENDVFAAAMTDKNGKGYIQFAKDDFEQVKECIPHFSDVMTTLKNKEIAELMDSASPVTEAAYKNLKPITKLPDIPKVSMEAQVEDVTLIPVALRFKDSPDKVEVMTFSEQETEGLDIDSQVFFSGYTHDQLKEMAGRETGEDFTIESVGEPYQVKAREVDPHAKDGHEEARTERTIDDRASEAYSHTQGIRDKVLAAREQCHSFDDFKELLAKDGIGVTETKDGELMFYEARLDADGGILPRGENEEGLMDWAVSARTLRDKWECEATHDWFEKNMPKNASPAHPRDEIERTVTEPQVADGSLDMNGSTPDVNQGIESHDGMDTMVSTLRVDREQHGTEVSPTMVREQSDRSREAYNLKSKADEVRAASRQLSKANESPDRDISDKFQQER